MKVSTQIYTYQLRETLQNLHVDLSSECSPSRAEPVWHPLLRIVSWCHSVALAQLGLVWWVHRAMLCYTTIAGQSLSSWVLPRFLPSFLVSVRLFVWLSRCDYGTKPSTSTPAPQSETHVNQSRVGSISQLLHRTGGTMGKGRANCHPPQFWPNQKQTLFTPFKLPEISKKNWRAKLKPFLTPYLQYKVRLKA